MRTKNILGLMLLGTLLMIPEMSWALSFFTPSGDDVSINALLSKLFGGAMPGGGSGGAGSDPFAGFFTVLNAGALAVGGILAAYNLVVGSMQTAHEGEMLGRKWSSMWLPIRTAMGTAMVAPLGTGYCVAQLIVMWLAVQGVGLADKGWNAFVSTGFDQMVASAAHAAPNVNNLSANVLQIQTCMSTLDYLSRKYPTTMGDKAPITSNISNSSVWGGEAGIAFGTSLDPNYCGTVTVNTPSTLTTASNNFSNATGWMNSISGIVSGFTSPPQVNSLQAKHLEQTRSLISSAKPIGDYLVKVSEVDKSGSDTSVNLATENSMINNYKNAVEQYKTNIIAIADSATTAGSLNSLKADSTKGGWIMAGAWFPKIAAYLNAINAAVNHVPNAKIGPVIQNNEGLWGNVQGSFSGFISRSNLTDTGNPLVGANNPEESSLGVGADIGKALGGVISGINLGNIATDTRHPVIIAQDIGDRMTTSGMAIGAMGLASSGAGGLMSGLPGAGKALMGGAFSSVGTALLTGALVLITFGYFLKIYIPLMPFIHFFFGALSWVLLVGEAMIAAPLWAVMHLTGSGDDIMGGSRNGYAILLGLLLRPVLLIAGFIFAIIVMYPIGILFNSIYFSVFKLSMVEGGGFVDGFVFMIAGLVIYCLLINSLYSKALRLMTDVPNQALQWFGAQGHQIGQSGQQAAQEIGGRLKSGVAGGVAASMLQQGGQGISSALGRVSGEKTQKAKDAKDSADKKADSLEKNQPMFNEMTESGQGFEKSADELISDSANPNRSEAEIKESNMRISRELSGLKAHSAKMAEAYKDMPQLKEVAQNGKTNFQNMREQNNNTATRLNQALENNNAQLASMAQSKTEKPNDNGQMDLFDDGGK